MRSDGPELLCLGRARPAAIPDGRGLDQVPDEGSLVLVEPRSRKAGEWSVLESYDSQTALADGLKSSLRRSQPRPMWQSVPTDGDYELTWSANSYPKSFYHEGTDRAWFVSKSRQARTTIKSARAPGASARLRRHRLKQHFRWLDEKTATYLRRSEPQALPNVRVFFQLKGPYPERRPPRATDDFQPASLDRLPERHLRKRLVKIPVTRRGRLNGPYLNPLLSGEGGTTGE